MDIETSVTKKDLPADKTEPNKKTLSKRKDENDEEIFYDSLETLESQEALESESLKSLTQPKSSKPKLTCNVESSGPMQTRKKVKVVENEENSSDKMSDSEKSNDNGKFDREKRTKTAEKTQKSCEEVQKTKSVRTRSKSAETQPKSSSSAPPTRKKSAEITIC